MEKCHPEATKGKSGIGARLQAACSGQQPEKDMLAEAREVIQRNMEHRARAQRGKVAAGILSRSRRTEGRSGGGIPEMPAGTWRAWKRGRGTIQEVYTQSGLWVAGT